MNDFQVGYASVNINPELGIAIDGYYIPRFANGFIDDLHASVLALKLGDKNILLVSVDNLAIKYELVQKIATSVQTRTGISNENIFISATHSHTAPCSSHCTFFEAPNEPIDHYITFLINQIVEASTRAISDLKPAKMGYAVGRAPDRIAYIRRYKMKNGKTCTCPPINDPNIDHPIGKLDQRVNVLRFDREGAESVVVLNYGLHADTVNGEKISSDWVGWLRNTVEAALGGTKCMCIIGAQGDVGSTNVYPTAGDMNDTEISFDNEMKSPGMARFVGRALAGTILQVYDKVSYVNVDEINILHRLLVVPANIPSKEELLLAHKFKKLHAKGRDDLIPYEAMELTTVVAEALRMCNMENGPTEFELHLVGVRIGKVVLIGIPGEPFTEIGVKIKENEGWDMIMPCGLTNGYEGYFPVKSAFDEGGYEARTSPYKETIATDIIDCAKEILKKL